MQWKEQYTSPSVWGQPWMSRDGVAGEASGFPAQVRSASLGFDSNFQHSSSTPCLTAGSFLPTTANPALAFLTQNELLEWRRSFPDAAELRAAQDTGKVRPEQLF